MYIFSKKEKTGGNDSPKSMTLAKVIDKFNYINYANKEKSVILFLQADKAVGICTAQMISGNNQHSISMWRRL